MQRASAPGSTLPSPPVRLLSLPSVRLVMVKAYVAAAFTPSHKCLTDNHQDGESDHDQALASAERVCGLLPPNTTTKEVGVQMT